VLRNSDKAGTFCRESPHLRGF